MHRGISAFSSFHSAAENLGLNFVYSSKLWSQVPYGALSAGLAIYPLDPSGSRGSKRFSAAKIQMLNDSWGGV